MYGLQPTTGRPQSLPIEDDSPRIGSWYWLRDGKEEHSFWVACVTYLGSNYAELSYVSGSTQRVHLSEFPTSCLLELDSQEVLDREVTYYQASVHRLMGEVQELVSRLALSAPSAASDPEVGALVLATGSRPAEAYKEALVEAKGKTLPTLFEEIRKGNERLARWMTASLLPLKASADRLRPLLQAVEQRIFNVELYAGLVEQVVQVRGGNPAPADTPIHLFQRRHYMDEECLARYEVGGMQFKDMDAFDAWLARPDNLDRLLPHPRSVVAFRVRRRDKEMGVYDLSSYFDVLRLHELDRLTFLYLRNGEQLSRLETAIEFGEQLFPDGSVLDTSQPLYAKMSGSSVDRILSEGEYRGMSRDERRWYNNFEPFSPESVYYDDISRHVSSKMEEHNRVVVVLQGLLDRSPVFHPHPPWHLWTQDGFAAALSLVFDQSRALVPGEAPDFEAYRARLNASLAEGSITVGQEDFWERREAERENERQRQDWRIRSWSHYERFRPHDDPGPGRLARVAKVARGSCSFAWIRPRRGYGWETSPIARAITVPKTELLNVSAYTPGDFRQFFDDPRTRADYLRWAPLLLEAEEFHAGNRKLRGD